MEQATFNELKSTQAYTQLIIRLPLEARNTISGSLQAAHGPLCLRSSSKSRLWLLVTHRAQLI